MIPVRFHHLKAIGTKSPAYAQMVMRGEEQAPTTAMQLGSGVDAILLGGKRVICYPGATRRGKEWEAFAADNADAEILSRGEYDKAMGMVAAVRANKDAMRLLDGKRQQRLLWHHGERLCQSTPDVYADDFVTDLKTGQSSDPKRFTGQALRYCYNAQLAFYGEALRKLELSTVRDHYIVAVESSPPFPVTILRLTERAIEAGDRMWRGWFEQLRACEESDMWPGYVQSIVDLDVPEDMPEFTFGDESEAA